MTRSVRALGAVVLGVLLLAGCGTKPPAEAPPTHPAAAPAPPAAPKVGSCYGMSMKQALAWTSSAKVKPCNGTHTTETFFVGQLDTAVDGHLVAVDSDRTQAQVTSACRAKVSAFVGGTPDQLRLSMVRPVWFTPTVSQSDEGANWYRCDAVVVASPDSLSPRIGTLKGVLKGTTTRTAVSMCGTDAPTAKDFHRVLCSAKHSWRAVAVVPMKPGKYPGEKVARGAAGTRCEQAASAAAGNPLSFQFGYEFPTADDWANGQDYGICWAKS
jgi:hypothetical protein